MKYLYNFSVPELKITLKACLDYKASKAYSMCSAEDIHALDSIIDYCESRLREFESLDVTKTTRCGWRDRSKRDDLDSDK